MTTFTSIAQLREARNQKLKETDFLLVADIPLTQEEKEIVLIYRKQLRDLPAAYTDQTVGDAVLPNLTGTNIRKLLV